MNFRAWRALARGVVLESVRRKDLWVVAILGFLIMASAGAIGFFGTRGLESFAKDLAAAVLGSLSAIVAVMTTCRLLPDEIRNRTLYPLVARPVTRFDLLVGKLLGAVWVTWIAFLLLASLTAVALTIFGVRFEAIMLQYVLCKMLGLAVLCSVSMALSLFMTPAAATTISLVLAFGTGMMVRALTLAYDSASPTFQWVYRAVNAVLPQYDLFDLGSRAANFGWGPVPLWVVGALTAYAVVYSACALTLGWLKFRRQEV